MLGTAKTALGCVQFLLTVLVVSLVVSGRLDASNALQEKLAGAAAITCQFPVMVAGDWTSGKPVAATKSVRPLRIDFTAIDLDAGHAEASTGFGEFQIIAQVSGDTINFLQMYREGALYVTTVFAAESRAGRVKAIHSRHTYESLPLPGFTSRPEQYYGDCEISP